MEAATVVKSSKLVHMYYETSHSSHKYFTIVRHAENGHWEHHYLEDPKIKGVKKLLSAANSRYGAAANIKIQYNSIEEAQLDVVKIMKHNPWGGYAVCPLR